MKNISPGYFHVVHDVCWVSNETFDISLDLICAWSIRTKPLSYTEDYNIQLTWLPHLTTLHICFEKMVKFFRRVLFRLSHYKVDLFTFCLLIKVQNAKFIVVVVHENIVKCVFMVPLCLISLGD